MILTEDDKQKHITGFKQYLTLKGLKPGTIRERLINLKMLFNYLEERQQTLSGLRAKAALDFQGYVIETGEIAGKSYSHGTVLNYMTMAKTFYDYLINSRKVSANPFEGMKKIKPTLKLPHDILEESEMKMLLDWFGNFTEEPGQIMGKRYRVHVIAELLYSTGMRISEAAGLTCDDVDLERGIVHLRRTKNGKERICFLNDYARQILKIYMNETRPLFVSKLGDPSKLFGAGVRKIKMIVNAELKRACEKLGLTRQSSKGFRHAVGFHFLRKGCNIRYIQEILGHVKIRSTEIYTKVVKEDLRGVIDKFHPRRWNHEA